MTEFVMPKGRQKIRRTDAPHLPGDPTRPVDGRDNRRVRLWDFEAKPGSTLAKLETAYLSALDAVDAVAEHKTTARQSIERRIKSRRRDASCAR